MAEITQKVDSVGSNNYINYSERYSGNQGWGTLFEGLGKSADQLVQKSLQNQVTGIVQGLDNSVYGMDAIAEGVTDSGQPQQTAQPTPGQTPPGGTPPDQLPTPLKEGLKTIGLLTKSKDAGSMSPGNYSAQLYTKVKALKAQYPGYSNDIDEMVRVAYNAPAANLLRQQIIDQLKGNQDSEAQALKDRKKFIEENKQYLSTQGLQDYGNSGDVSDEEIRSLRFKSARAGAETAQQDATLKGLQIDIAQLNRDEKVTSNIQQRAGEYAIGEFSLVRTQIMDGAGGITALREQIKAFNADNIISPDEHAAIADGVRKVNALIDERTDAFLNKVVRDDGTTLAMILPKEARDEIEANRTHLKSRLDDITGGDAKSYAVLGMDAALIETGRSSDVLKMWNTDPGKAARGLAALDKLSGGATNTITNTLFTQQYFKNDDSPLIQGLKAALAGKVLTEGYSPTQAAADLDGKIPDQEKGAIVSAQVDMAMDMTVNPEMPADVRLKAAQSIVVNNAGFFDRISTKVGKDGLTEKERVWRRINNPEFAKAVVELGKTNPELVQGYRKMIVEAGAAIMKPYADTAQSDIVELNKYAKLSWSAERKQFVVQVDEGKFKNPELAKNFLTYYMSGQSAANLFLGDVPDASKLDAGDANALAQLRRGLEAVRSVNVYVAGVTPWFEAEGVDLQQGVTQALGVINLSAPKTQPFLNWVVNGFKEDPNYGKGPESDTYVDVPGEDALQVSPGMAPQPNAPRDKQSMNLPDGTKIEPASYTFEGDTEAPSANTTFADHMQTAQVPYNKAVGGSKDFNKKVPLLMTKLMADPELGGLTDYQAAGIIGNLAHESAGLQPGIAGDSGSAHGWAQWNGPRKKAMIAWAKANGMDPNTDDANYGYLIYDLKTNYPKTLEKIKKAKSMREAAKIFMDEFENPGVPLFGNRLKYGEQALSAVKPQP